MLGFGYFPVITLHSMIHNNDYRNSFSLIDQTWSNFLQGTHHLGGIVKFLISDHLPNFYIFKLKSLKPRITKRFRVFNQSSITNFTNLMHHTDFTDIFTENDPEVCFSRFYKRLFNIYSTSFPIKKRKLKDNLINEPWVTRKLKKMFFLL